MKNEFKVIADLIEKDKRVLDVGCADGTLMKFLKDHKNINIRGLEISKDKVQKCIAKGLTVIEGNAEKDLKQFPDKSFDYVVLSQTLQAFLNPELVINELLRETLLTYLHKEIPYNVIINTTDYRVLKNNDIKIKQKIVINEKRYKKIILGKKGEMIKAIREDCQKKMSTILNNKVHLYLEIINS